MRLTAQPATSAAMEPFGALITPPAQPGARAFYTPWLDAPAGDRTPRLHLNHVPQTHLPHRVALLEKHPHAAQIFLPVEASRFLIIVAPSHADGSPDLARTQAFVAPGNVGVVYRAGVWHAGATALDAKAHFAVHMSRNDRDDDVFLPLEDPIEVTL